VVKVDFSLTALVWARVTRSYNFGRLVHILVVLTTLWASCFHWQKLHQVLELCLDLMLLVVELCEQIVGFGNKFVFLLEFLALTVCLTFEAWRLGFKLKLQLGNLVLILATFSVEALNLSLESVHLSQSSCHFLRFALQLTLERA